MTKKKKYNNKIDADRLREIWRDGRKKKIHQTDIVRSAAKEFDCHYNSVWRKLKLLGLLKKEEAIQRGVKKEITSRVFRDSEKLYEEKIEFYQEAKLALSDLRAIININKQDIERERKSKKKHYKDAGYQKMLIEANDKAGKWFERLMKFEETIHKLEQYNNIKQIILEALERADPELKERVARELRAAELNTRTMFGNRTRPPAGYIEGEEKPDDPDGQ